MDRPKFKYEDVPVDMIDSPEEFNRKYPYEFNVLVDSINKQGLRQNLGVVRHTDTGRCIVFAGVNCLKVMKHLGKTEVHCGITEEPNREAALKTARLYRSHQED